jgi:hypothetical protein
MRHRRPVPAETWPRRLRARAFTSLEFENLKRAHAAMQLGRRPSPRYMRRTKPISTTRATALSSHSPGHVHSQPYSRSGWVRRPVLLMICETNISHIILHISVYYIGCTHTFYIESYTMTLNSKIAYSISLISTAKSNQGILKELLTSEHKAIHIKWMRGAYMLKSVD